MIPTPYTRWPVVEGYTDRLSFHPGETVDVRCSARTPAFSVEVFRIGRARTRVWGADRIAGSEQPVPERAWAEGCGWPVTFTIPIGADWRPGFYEISFRAGPVDGATGDAPDGGTSAPEARSEAFFVVGSAPGPDRPPVVLIVATNTWNAYNQWGGACLYSGADRVSFARPLERGFLRRPAAPTDVDFDGRIASVGPDPDPTHLALQRYQVEQNYPLWCASAGWHNWERRFVAWAERAGIELDYAVDADLQFRPDLLEGRTLGLTVGHNEYWSWEMRDAVDGFVDRGGNWAVFGGNTCFWQVRYEDDVRTMVCHKNSAEWTDPVYRSEQRERTTTSWADPRLGRPETLTIGLSFTRGGYARMGEATPAGPGGYVIARPGHWALDGTGLHWGDLLGGPSRIVAYEVDGCTFTLEHGLPVPTHEDGAPDDLEIIATAPARLLSITPDHCEAPLALWPIADPPGDLETVAAMLFGGAAPADVARLAANHAVMATFTRGPGSGTVFNAGTTDWAYGLDTDPQVQRVTANVVRRLGGV